MTTTDRSPQIGALKQADLSTSDPRPIIIKIGGSTLDGHRDNPAMWRALASLAARTPAGIVLVHGGGKAVDRHLARLGVVSERRQGLRVTPTDQIGDIVGVLAGTVNKAIVSELNRAGARAVGLFLGDGAMTRCRVLRPGGVDLGRVGEIEGGDGALARALLSNGFLPVVSSVGLNDDGFLNVNADDAAAGLARILKARSLVLLTDVAGIKGADGAIVPSLTIAGVEALIAASVISGGMIPKSRAASKIAAEFEIPVVILSGEDPDHLTRWAEGGTVGTSIIPG